jgi:hypothetical protein
VEGYFKHFSVNATSEYLSNIVQVVGFELFTADYEECRLLGYRKPVRTSQETHYVSTTESRQLNLCKI